ncbi:hypothetical protein AVEN_231424-1 [Araneus ventricosus]|uniref:Uncharacterized protein n=1 Tax=Araneus ventricosus TaxID=182803 RepID=A0A4Y2S6L7_ARAVE|nr:hypothetical protein AVEN_141451-1 [Araneus ventricosus]GBN83888.1 hypothetical protein AVEN_126181-1 [Araneus ventricosus]GBN87535.1 hypothetical protein AVEN_230543-1 [Araneus ventricosus]GBN87541.1 hypothetical protein AVEN_231424-1 [Araneus ventricosus]
MGHCPVTYTGSINLAQHSVSVAWSGISTTNVFRRPLTPEFHLNESSDEHRKIWFKNLRHNGQTQSKLIQELKVSNDICDRPTQN